MLKIVKQAGLPESPEELTKRITRGFIVELLNVVIINPIIQVGMYGNHQHVIYSKRDFFISEIST